MENTKHQDHSISMQFSCQKNLNLDLIKPSHLGTQAVPSFLLPLAIAPTAFNCGINNGFGICEQAPKIASPRRRMEEWTSLGQHKRKPEFPVVI